MHERFEYSSHIWLSGTLCVINVAVSLIFATRNIRTWFSLRVVLNLLFYRCTNLILYITRENVVNFLSERLLIMIVIRCDTSNLFILLRYVLLVWSKSSVIHFVLAIIHLMKFSFALEFINILLITKHATSQS